MHNKMRQMSPCFIWLPKLFVLDFEAVRSNIDLQTFRLLLGLVEIVGQHAYDHQQRANYQKQDIAVTGHLDPSMTLERPQCRQRSAILKVIAAKWPPLARQVRR